MLTSTKHYATCLLILTLLAIGCADGNSNANGAKTDDEKDSKADNSANTGTKKTPKEFDGKTPDASSRRTSMKGKWILVISQQGSDIPITLLEFEKVDDELKATLIEKTAELDNAVLKSSQIDGNSLRLKFTVGEQERTFDVQGTLIKGVVWGNVVSGDGNCYAARLFATQRKSLTNTQPEHSTGYDEFNKAVNSDDSFAALTSFIKRNSDSPLALDAYDQIVIGAKKSELKQKDIESIAGDYHKLAGRWGTRMQQMSVVNVGFYLAITRYLPDVALKFLAEGESALAKKPQEGWERLITSAQQRAKAEQARRMVVSDDKQQQIEGVKRLHTILEESPFDPNILYTLASHAEKQEDVDEAIDLHARIAVLPTLETMLISEWSNEQAEHTLPSEVVASLWKQKHGDTEKLDAFLDEVYEKSIYAFADKRTAPRGAEGGNRVALVELFTGAKCPPCVAADVATGGLEKTFGKSEVIVLRYHQHIPGPDPFANSDSEARFSFYDGRGTPTVTLNGTSFENPMGGLMQVPGVYKRLSEDIKPILEETTAVKLALTAAAKDGKLTLTAVATGFDPEATEDLKLRLVLAEDTTFFKARNGIRLHEMVVRAMPGGHEGVPVADGALKYEETIDLGEFRQKLATYLDDYEREQGAIFGDFEFSAKPLDMSKLHLVAFVQDEETRKVLQSAAIPVTGKIEFPALKKPVEKKPTDDKPTDKKDKSEKPKTDKPKTDKPKTDAKKKDEAKPKSDG